MCNDYLSLHALRLLDLLHQTHNVLYTDFVRGEGSEGEYPCMSREKQDRHWKLFVQSPPKFSLY